MAAFLIIAVERASALSGPRSFSQTDWSRSRRDTRASAFRWSAPAVPGR